MTLPPIILCLGNEVVSDDGFGPAAAKLLENDEAITAASEVIFAPVAGFALIDLLKDRPRALIVDTIQTANGIPGKLHFFDAGILAPARHLTSSHQISLPTALALARKLQITMPRQIDVLAVEPLDITTLREELTAPVEQALPEAVKIIREWVLQVLNEEG